MDFNNLTWKQSLLIGFFALLVLPVGCAYTLTRIETEPSPSAKQATPVADYDVIEERDISYAGCRRVGLVVTMADDTSSVLVEATMQAIVERYRRNWDDITVWAHRHSERDNAKISPYSLGTKEYSTCD